MQIETEQNKQDTFAYGAWGFFRGGGGAATEQSDGVICWTIPTAIILLCIGPLYSTRERCLTIQKGANTAIFVHFKYQIQLVINQWAAFAWF